MATIFAGDESGNLGFAFTEGGTPIFVLALVSFNDLDLARFEVGNFKLSNKLVGSDLSFHKTTSQTLRERFFDSLNTLDMTAWVLVVRKDNLDRTLVKMPKPDLYALFLSEAIIRIPLSYRARGVLVLDAFDRAGRILLAVGRMLKAHGMNRGFKKITTRRSASEPLIQVADMIAGAAFWQFGRQEGRLLERLNHEVVISEYP